PWCTPDASTLDEVIEVTERCASGALNYTVKDGSREEKPPPQNTLMVTCNGPYYLHGDLDIDAATDDMPGVKFRAALCRCGKSMNKPFCDGSHDDIHFKDYGAVGKRGAGLSTEGGKITVRQLKDGPIIVEGNLTLYAGSGRKAWQGKKVPLCRCGASKNKPFCDGSHVEAGFKSE
ncbi:MAG: CDGSH iron-sulfur domain-containing protein, partial [Thiohalomonadales bacterium]